MISVKEERNYIIKKCIEFSYLFPFTVLVVAEIHRILTDEPNTLGTELPKNLALNVVAKANRLAAGSAGVARTNTIAVSPGVARANSVAVSSSVARANSIATSAGVAKTNSIATAENIPENIAKAVDSSKQGTIL